MKIQLILFLALLVLITSCRKKCTEEASKKSYLNPKLDGYFGIFKKGNYWVYENQDKTKRDSIYVTAYDRKFITDIETCDGFETLDFTLKEKDSYVVSKDSVCMFANYNIITTQSCPDSLFFSFYGRMSIYSDTIHYTSPVKIINSIDLNNQLYSGIIMEIYNADTLYMQQNIGIIGWKKNNETYNLVKKYLQP